MSHELSHLLAEHCTDFEVAHEYHFLDTFDNTTIMLQEDIYKDILVIEDGVRHYFILNEELRKALRKPPYTFIDLFCGCGGASLGLKQGGMKHLCGIDIEKWACKTYQVNLGNVIRADVTQLPLRDGIEPDFVWASAPCQDFSSLRPHRALHKNSPKNYLIVVSAILIRQLHPKLAMMENVPLAMKSWQWRAAKQILRDGGYDVRDFLLDAVNYGVPQYRVRAFMTASRVGPAMGRPMPTHGMDEEQRRRFGNTYSARRAEKLAKEAYQENMTERLKTD